MDLNVNVPKILFVEPIIYVGDMCTENKMYKWGLGQGLLMKLHGRVWKDRIWRHSRSLQGVVNHKKHKCRSLMPMPMPVPPSYHVVFFGRILEAQLHALSVVTITLLLLLSKVYTYTCIYLGGKKKLMSTIQWMTYEFF